MVGLWRELGLEVMAGQSDGLRRKRQGRWVTLPWITESLSLGEGKPKPLDKRLTKSFSGQGQCFVF